jgi:hypothetical protein
MKIPMFSAIALSAAVLGFASSAPAQQGKKLFFEGDLVRHRSRIKRGLFAC